MADLKSYTSHYTLTAGLTNARSEMPVTLVIAHAIETATLHANALGIGYSTLHRHNLGWVLARLTVEIYDLPAINSSYSMTTWIAGINRRFSDRCYEMCDESGRRLVAIRSVWVAIDMTTRSMADLSKISPELLPTEPDRECPIARCVVPAIAPDAATESLTHTFSYTDIDFNRHVNTLRYIEAVLNTRSLDFHDLHTIKRLEASFEHECHYRQNVALITGRSIRDPESVTTRIVAEDGTTAVSIAIKYVKSPIDQKTPH